MNCAILIFFNNDNYIEFKEMLEKENLGFYECNFKNQLIMDCEEWDIEIDESFQELVDKVDYIYLPYGLYNL